MKQTKFKIWDKNENKFIEIERLTGRTPKEYFYSNYVLGFDGKIYLVNGKGWFAEAKDLISIQSTGKIDKNDVEIYEGDIVYKKGYGGNGFIEWDEEWSGWRVNFLEGTGGGLITEHIFGDTLEVKGHIKIDKDMKLGYVTKKKVREVFKDEQ